MRPHAVRVDGVVHGVFYDHGFPCALCGVDWPWERFVEDTVDCMTCIVREAQRNRTIETNTGGR